MGGFEVWFDETGYPGYKEEMRLAWETAALVERDACAKVCDEIEHDYYRDNKCATAIRKRSNAQVSSRPQRTE